MINMVKNFFQSIFAECEKNKFRLTLLFSIIISFFAYCFSIPAFSNIHPFNYLSIGICGIMCVLMLLYTFLYSKIKINILIGFLFIFNICIVLTHLINRTFYDTPKTIFLMSAVSFCVYQFACSIKRKEVLFVAILVAGFLFSAIFIIYFRSKIFNLSNLFKDRLGVPFDNENEIAKEFSFFALISFAFIFKSKKIVSKILLSFLTALFVFLLMTTGSISALLSTILVGVICSILFEKTVKGKIIIGAVTIAVIGLFVVLLQIPQLSYFKDRIANIFKTLFSFGKEAEDGSSLSRFEAALTSFKIGFSKPIFGYGYMASTNFNNLNIQAHNNLAELFLDFGAIGLIIFESALLLPLFYTKKHENRELIFSIFIFMFVFQFFLTTYYKKFEYIFFALGFAILDDVFDFSFVIHNSSMLKKNNKKKRIIEIIPSLSPVGGAETFLVDFITNIKKRYDDRFEVILIILYEQSESPLIDKIKENDITIYQLNKHKGFDIKCAFKLRDIVLDYYPDIVHSHLLTIRTIKMAFPLRRKRIKFFHTIHHNYSGNKSDDFLVKLIKRNYLNPICVAETPAKEYSKVCNKNICYINNGIDISKFDNSISLSKRDIDFLVVGRFVQVKNHQKLLEIINRYFSDEKYKFVFLGDGELLPACKEYCDNNKLDKIVTFYGSVDDVNKYMSNSKILIMPSLNEGNPIVINEAIASGMLVIGNDVGGIHDLLINNNYGFLIDINDDQKFALTMRSVIKKANERKGKIKNNDLDRISISRCVDEYLVYFGLV